MSIQKKYWDIRADEWKTRNVLITNTNIDLFNIINNIPDIENKTICEFGVGTGRYLGCIKKYKYLYGIDFMEKHIAVANKIKPNNCEVFVDDIVNLKFNIPVDIIFTVTTLQHIHPSQIEKAIQNIVIIGSHDIILFESTDETFSNKNENDPKNYQWGHNYIKLFNNFNYKLVNKILYSNNNYTLHFKKIINLS